MEPFLYPGTCSFLSRNGWRAMATDFRTSVRDRQLLLSTGSHEGGFEFPLRLIFSFSMSFGVQARVQKRLPLEALCLEPSLQIGLWGGGTWRSSMLPNSGSSKLTSPLGICRQSLGHSPISLVKKRVLFSNSGPSAFPNHNHIRVQVSSGFSVTDSLGSPHKVGEVQGF